MTNTTNNANATAADVKAVESLTTLASSVYDASQDYAAYLDGDPEQEEADWQGLKQENAYKSEVEQALRDMAKDHGLDVARGYDSHSTYWDVLNRDGTSEFQVRASNHAQKYAGPVASFTPHDSEQDVRRKLGCVNDAMREVRG